MEWEAGHKRGGKSEQAYWIWYPGDFEIYHGNVQNVDREERGFRWAGFWYLADIRKNVRFHKEVEVACPETIIVSSHSLGYAAVDGKKYVFGRSIELQPGRHSLEICAALLDGVPSVYVEGSTVHSGTGWQVDDFVDPPVPVGKSEKYRNREQNPSVWEFCRRNVYPQRTEELAGGLLISFAAQLTAELKITKLSGALPLRICYGESIAEALDEQWCYYSQSVTKENEVIPKRTFQYLYVPGGYKGDIELYAEEVYEDILVKASFTCGDEEMNQIWRVAVRTFQLCSGIFFIDGAKRDRWIWSGDAYQSYFVNQYLMFDEDINKRTMWALRGNDPVRQHINTIVDYSMYWVMSIYDHYYMTGDLDFVRTILPRVLSMMDYLEEQLDENGFIVGHADDWIFVDWADIDKEGAVCAEQILLAQCYKTAAELLDAAGSFRECESLDKPEFIGESDVYRSKYKELIANINEFYWDQEKSAYVDSFSSGKRHVSRHSNIFAILFGIAGEEQIRLVSDNVIENPGVPAITTPYFKFYELEALCFLGKNEEVKRIIKEYWGGMLKLGATTFWEEYDPRKSGKEHYEMYGDPFGKSLCHAWSASPIYLIGRYFMGIRATAPGYQTFLVEPDLTLFEEVSCEFPVKDGKLKVSVRDGELKVCADRAGGTLRVDSKEWELVKGQEVRLVVKY